MKILYIYVFLTLVFISCDTQIPQLPVSIDADEDGVSDTLDLCSNTPNGESVNAQGCSASQIDTDEDGVSDTLDLCSNTPNGESVNAQGCSASQIDTDEDGVSDTLDLCSNTPNGESVNAQGCSASQIDTDEDGVSDTLDLCSNTPNGESVNAQGCSASQLFDSDGDGVSDAFDSCIYTFSGEEVNAQGCSIYDSEDFDNDGIVNGSDLCERTSVGENVDEKGCTIEDNEDYDNDGVIVGADFCPHTPNGQIVNVQGCAKTVTNDKPNVYAVDAQGFYGNTHGTRIKKTFDYTISDTSLVHFHYYENLSPFYFFSAHGNPPYNSEGIDLINYHGYVQANNPNFTTIFFSSTNSSPLYQSATLSFWEEIDGRPFFKTAIASAEYIRDYGKALMIVALENSTVAPQGDSSIAHNSDEDFRNLPLAIPLSGVLTDYIAHKKTGIEKVIFVGVYNTEFDFFEAAITQDGVFNENTIFVATPSVSEVPTVQPTTSHASPVLAAYATQILNTNANMTAEELRTILFSLAVEETKKQLFSINSSGIAQYKPFTGKLLTKEAVDNYVQNH